MYHVLLKKESKGRECACLYAWMLVLYDNSKNLIDAISPTLYITHRSKTLNLPVHTICIYILPKEKKNKNNKTYKNNSQSINHCQFNNHGLSGVFGLNSGEEGE